MRADYTVLSTLSLSLLFPLDWALRRASFLMQHAHDLNASCACHLALVS